jgi:DNA-binding transcriptional ArsR family regulator
MDEIETLADIFKALADPTRLRLVRLLGERTPEEVEPDECGGGPLCVNALAHRLGITQSAVSQHLRVLRQARLVKCERRGAFVHYSLDEDGASRVKATLQETLGERFG